MKRFVDQVVMITGAANGIGRASAVRFAGEGARVACLDLDEKHNQDAADLCRDQGAEALALSCDVTKRNSIQSVVDIILEKWEQIDVLVASAGIYTGSPLDEVSEEEWQRTLDINLTGVFLTNQAVAPILIGNQSGSIINLSSMAGKTSWPASAAYSASKSGVIGLTRSVAMEMAPFGPTANAVCPGNTLTDMVRNVAKKVGEADGLSAQEWLEMRANDCPMKRLAEPWEIAGVISFLASEDSRYLTGQALEVDGGIILS